MRQTQPSPFLIQFRQALWWFLLTILLIIGLHIFINRYFLVRKVSCTINHSLPCTQSLIIATDEFIGKPMLFYNYHHRLNSLFQPSLNFQSFNYVKLLPYTLKINFIFQPPTYQLVTPNNLIMGFDQFGEFSFLPPEDNVLIIKSYHQVTNQALTQYQLDPVLHQKFMQLDYFTADQRQNWQMVNFIALNHLEIITTKATYILDLFNLDENLQKMTFLEDNWQSLDHGQIVDLRFRLPVIKENE